MMTIFSRVAVRPPRALAEVEEDKHLSTWKLHVRTRSFNEGDQLIADTAGTLEALLATSFYPILLSIYL